MGAGMIKRVVTLYAVSWVAALFMAGIFQMGRGTYQEDGTVVYQPFPWGWTFIAAGVIALLAWAIYGWVDDDG